MAVQLDIREVQVQQVNDHGIKADGAWLNVSKYANPGDVVMPSAGARVVVHLDKAGFVRKVEPVAPPSPAITAQATPEATAAPVSAPAFVQDDRGVVVTRLAVLNTATALLSSGSRAATPADLLALAGQLEAWATR